MSADVVEQWHRSRQPAQLNGMRFWPKSHPVLKDAPIVVQRGQAGAIFLVAEDRSDWILKKFHRGRCPDNRYLRSISTVLPAHEGFRAGTDRQVLSSHDLRAVEGCYHNTHFKHWLDGSVLMPRVQGVDWATIADEIRAGNVQLEQSDRLAYCYNLTQLVRLLEAHQCAHRDFSSGNILLDTGTHAISLIDFDSFYHPSLSMPVVTTCGTEGYTPPFAWRRRQLDAAATWCEGADRYALALLNVEFIILQKDAPLTGEGGVFDQRELRTRSGPGLIHVRDRLRACLPTAMPLLDSALAAQCCQDCPAPEEWIRILGSGAATALKPPALNELETISPRYFEERLARCRPAAPLWPAPTLSEMPVGVPRLAGPALPAVTLPADPWQLQEEQSEQ